MTSTKTQTLINQLLDHVQGMGNYHIEKAPDSEIVGICNKELRVMREMLEAVYFSQLDDLVLESLDKTEKIMWINYDYQTGQWLVQDEPFLVVRPDAEILKVKVEEVIKC